MLIWLKIEKKNCIIFIIDNNVRNGYEHLCNIHMWSCVKTQEHDYIKCFGFNACFQFVFFIFVKNFEQFRCGRSQRKCDLWTHTMPSRCHHRHLLCKVYTIPFQQCLREYFVWKMYTVEPDVCLHVLFFCLFFLSFENGKPQLTHSLSAEKNTRKWKENKYNRLAVH